MQPKAVITHEASGLNLPEREEKAKGLKLRQVCQVKGKYMKEKGKKAEDEDVKLCSSLIRL